MRQSRRTIALKACWSLMDGSSISRWVRLTWTTSVRKPAAESVAEKPETAAVSPEQKKDAPKAEQKKEQKPQQASQHKQQMKQENHQKSQQSNAADE